MLGVTRQVGTKLKVDGPLEGKIYLVVVPTSKDKFDFLFKSIGVRFSFTDRL